MIKWPFLREKMFTFRDYLKSFMRAIFSGMGVHFPKMGKIFKIFLGIFVIWYFSFFWKSHTLAFMPRNMSWYLWNNFGSVEVLEILLLILNEGKIANAGYPGYTGCPAKKYIHLKFSYSKKYEINSNKIFSCKNI